MAIDRGLSSGNSRLISRCETTAWTTPESANPRISGHRISHPMASAICSACNIAFVIVSGPKMGTRENSAPSAVFLEPAASGTLWQTHRLAGFRHADSRQCLSLDLPDGPRHRPQAELGLFRPGEPSR